MILLVALALSARANPSRFERPDLRQILSLADGRLDQVGLEAFAEAMPPSQRALAIRHDPAARQPRIWGRPKGWSSYQLDGRPRLALGQSLTGKSALEINALVPRQITDIDAAKPFYLSTQTETGKRALNCLATAIYFEAASEPIQGQAAVAQVILNRVRDKSFPNTICGVVFQGGAMHTGCQFSFACTGAMTPNLSALPWRRAQMIAKNALSGFVVRTIGTATHYHADYVYPYWGDSLVKLTKVGRHIFYRWPGTTGEPEAFFQTYAGIEPSISQAMKLPAPIDPRLVMREVAAAQPKMVVKDSRLARLALARPETETRLPGPIDSDL